LHVFFEDGLDLVVEAGERGALEKFGLLARNEIFFVERLEPLGDLGREAGENRLGHGTEGHGVVDDEDVKMSCGGVPRLQGTRPDQ